MGSEQTSQEGVPFNVMLQLSSISWEVPVYSKFVAESGRTSLWFVSSSSGSKASLQHGLLTWQSFYLTSSDSWRL